MNEIHRLTAQIDELTMMLNDMKQTLQQISMRRSYGSDYVMHTTRTTDKSVYRTESVSMYPPRQTEMVDYARRRFPER